MDLYTCAARNDIDKYLVPTAQWGSSPGTPVNYAFWQGILNTGAAEMGQSWTYLTWPTGLTPFDIPKFCSYFKILKVKKDIKLIGAGFKSYMVKDRKWHIWNGTKVNGIATDATDNMFKGRTKFVFAMITAAAVNDNTDQTKANFGPVTVLVSGTERLSYTGVRNVSKIVNYVQDTQSITDQSHISTIDLQTELVGGYVVA